MMTSEKIIRLSANPEGFGSVPDELEAQMFVEKPAAQHTHLYYADEDRGLFVGVWDTTDMIETAGPYACDEFMFLIEGEACVKNSRTGAIETATAGEAFVIPRAYDCQWQQQAYLRKFFLISEHPLEPVPASPGYEGIIIPRPDDPLTSFTEAAPFLIESNSEAQKQHVAYRDGTGRFLAGTWVCEPFQSASRAFPYNEIAYVQAGSLALTDEFGEQQVFNAGDAFFVPQGVVCYAEASEISRLFFAVLSN